MINDDECTKLRSSPSAIKRKRIGLCNLILADFIGISKGELTNRLHALEKPACTLKYDHIYNRILYIIRHYSFSCRIMLDQPVVKRIVIWNYNQTFHGGWLLAILNI